MVASARALVSWSGWVLATLSGVSVARAAEPSRSLGSPEITWDAPPGCPDAESVAWRLVDALEGAPAGLGAGWQVHGRITGSQGSWQLAVTLAAPDAGQDTPPYVRVLDAKQCDDLGDAAAVAIAIALGDAASLDEAPAEATVEAPLPPVPSTALHGPALDTAPAMTPSRRNGADVPRRLSLGADLVLDSATLGGLVGGAAVEARGSLGRVGLGLYGLGLPASTQGIDTGQRAEFSLWVGGLRVCYAVPADWLSVAACAGGEIGALDAHVEGLRQGRDQSDLWLAPGLGVELGGKLLASVGLHSRVEVLFPILRQQYRVDLEQAIHDVPEATLRWSLGLDADVLGR